MLGLEGSLVLAVLFWSNFCGEIMIKKIVIAVLVLVLLLVGVAALQPDNYRVQRSASIKAPPEKVLALLSDFHQWPSWSPWEKLDPAMSRSYSGAASDVGAVYAWKGNDKVGSGRMEIVELARPTKLVIALDFVAPFQSHNRTEFVLVPQGDSTNVTWIMSGPANLMTKMMGLVTSMDTMIGKDFEAGLANLKAIAER